MHLRLWPQQALPRVWVMVLLALWMATVGNWPLWRELSALGHLGDLAEWGYAAGLGVVMASLTVVLMGIFCWPGTQSVVVAFLLLASALASYFMATYHVVIDSTMMTNVLQTDLRESLDLINWRLPLVVLVLAVLPFVWYWKAMPKSLPWGRLLKQNLAMVLGGFAIMALALVLTFQSFASLMRNHTYVRYLINPHNSIWALGVVASEPFTQRHHTLQPVGRDAVVQTPALQSTPPLLVLVVGETARSTNFAINGYARPTTPHLSALAGKGEVSSFSNVWSCGTSTATSLPCMFSSLGKERFEAMDAPAENLLDVLQHAGLGVIWVDNQSGCKGVCDRLPSYATTSLADPALCTDGQCLDAIMLRDLDTQIAALPPERRAKGVVVVLHQMGSHGPAYFKRSPAPLKRFQPECTTNVLKDCSREALINAYDNSIVYTDHFLNEVINWQKARAKKMSMAMVYLSDHGESLGENNLYLHGLPYAIAPDHQKRIPWVTWVSPEFQAQRGLAQSCINTVGDQRLSHDHLFHSVLGLMNVTTAVYQAPLDAYAPCVKSR